ncbi:unnamed protein product [Alternaria alternata]
MSGLLSILLLVIVTENTSAPAKHNKSTLDPTRYQCHKIMRSMATLRLREKPRMGEALDLIRTPNPTRRCTSPLRVDAFLAEKSPQIILLQDSDCFEKTPAITLTPASSTSVPTMNLTTWHTFAQNEWSTTDVHITTTQSEKKKHRGNKINCGICREDVEVNRKWLEVMEVGMTVETKDKAEVLEQDDHCDFGTMMKGLCLQASKPFRDIVMSDSWADVNT